MTYHVPTNDDRHEQPDCDCYNCQACDGEGRWSVDVPLYHGGSYEQEVVCEKCNGLGKITEDCPVHCPVEAV